MSLLELTKNINAFLVIFLIIIAILWIMLPFAVFGVKRRLDKVVKELRKLTEIMEKGYWKEK